MANLLEVSYAGVVNVKFSALSKRLVASALDLPYRATEDRDFRTEFCATRTFGVETDLSILDLLNVLYYGMESGTEAGSRMVQAGIKYALAIAKYSRYPVFTDIRRQLELHAVLECYPNCKIVRLIKEGEELQEPEAGDEQLQYLYDYVSFTRNRKVATIERKAGDSQATTFNKLQEILQWS
jgi:hypothetical protein